MRKFLHNLKATIAICNRAGRSIFSFFLMILYTDFQYYRTFIFNKRQLFRITFGFLISTMNQSFIDKRRSLKHQIFQIFQLIIVITGLSSSSILSKLCCKCVVMHTMTADLIDQVSS
jgi:hypothetical protein